MKYFIYLILFFSVTTNATLNEVDKTNIFSKNLMRNGGFESGKALWTASAGTFAVTTTNPMIGGMHATWDAAASADTLVNTAITIPTGMLGRAGVASCLITTASGTATHSLQAYDGTNILSTATVVSNTTPIRTSTNFIFPATGGSTIQLRLYANANEPSIAIDDCYIGPSEGFNVSNISQSMFIGSAYIAATTNCTSWTRTNTALGSVASDADCPGPTVDLNPGPGTIQTTDTDLPKFTVNNLPAGYYEVMMVVPANNASASNLNTYAINDGTTTSLVSASASGGTNQQATVIAYFNYSTAGNKTFELYVASSAGLVTVPNDTGRALSFSIKKYPLSSEQAYKPDTTAMSWSGYHDSTCSWARTNTAYGDPTADATCALVERSNTNFGTVTTYTVTNAMPGIVFTPKVAGKYYVCATPSVSGGTANSGLTWKLWDGTNTIVEKSATTAIINAPYPHEMCGFYTATSTSSVTLSIQTRATAGAITIDANPGVASLSNEAITWSIIAIDQSFPAPLIAGGVTSSSSSTVKIVSSFITNAGTPTVSRQDGSWISSLTDGGVGLVTINIAASTFSTAPNCTTTTSNANRICSITSSSTSAIALDCEQSSSGTNFDIDFYINCIGAP